MSTPATNAWTGIAGLRPCLKPDVDVFRHVYRGEPWYVFHDRAAHRYYRISAGGAEIIGSMDGQRSVAEIQASLAERDGDAAASEAQIAAFLGQLSALELLQTGAEPNLARLESRRAATRKLSLASGLRSPLSFRLSLLDPQPILDRMMPYVGWLFGPAGLAMWLVVVGVGAILGVMHWTELTADLSDRMLSAENLTVAWMVYPVVKIIHEFFHGFALRRCGAEVRQTGLLFIALMPLPFVDATASTVLERKGDRILVGAAGVLVEVFLGACAVIGWVNAEPSLFRVVCYNIIMISGFSTLLFNGNPLQRYDGYYVLTDLVEIPGLGNRAAQYIGYLVKRYILGDPIIQAPRATRGEKWWFVLYGPVSFVYRTGLVIVIAFYVAEKYPIIGLILGIWAVAGYLWMPLANLFRSASIRHSEWRGRALAGGGGALAVIAFLLLIPVPFGVTTQGMFDMPDDATIRAGVRGEVVAVLVKQGDRVSVGQPLLQLAEPTALAKVARLEAKLREQEATYTLYLATDRVKAANSAEQVEQARRELADARADVAALTILSPSAGTVAFHDFDGIEGRVVAKGEAIAEIWNPDRAVIRSFVPMGQIALVRSDTRAVQVRPSYDPSIGLPARISAIVPSATDRLPNPVLSLDGGGPYATKRGADNQLLTQEAMFQVDLRTDAPLPVDFLYGRAYVRFDLGHEPLAEQFWRKIRLVFLRRLNA